MADINEIFGDDDTNVENYDILDQMYSVPVDPPSDVPVKHESLSGAEDVLWNKTSSPLLGYQTPNESRSVPVGRVMPDLGSGGSEGGRGKASTQWKETGRRQDFAKKGAVITHPNIAHPPPADDIFLSDAREVMACLTDVLKTEGVVPRREYNDLMTREASMRSGLFESQIKMFVLGMKTEKSFSQTTALGDICNNLAAEVSKFTKANRELKNNVSSIQKETTRLPNILFEQMKKLFESAFSSSTKLVPQPAVAQPPVHIEKLKVPSVVNNFPAMKNLAVPMLKAFGFTGPRLDNANLIRIMFQVVGEEKMNYFNTYGLEPNELLDLKQSVIVAAKRSVNKLESEMTNKPLSFKGPPSTSSSLVSGKAHVGVSSSNEEKI